MRLATQLHIEENGAPGYEDGVLVDKVAHMDPSVQCLAKASVLQAGQHSKKN